jgi:lysophospholipase L1-like esterase
MLKNSIAFIVSILVSVLILEVFLHIYNPFEPRIKGDQIQLPVHRKYEIHNDRIKALAPEILHTRNGLGFRGPELPGTLTEIPSIICIGGSTTECYYLSDGEDWPARLSQLLLPKIPNVWVNNGGLDGHSTWGHQLLLDQYILKLKPRYVLILAGINDVGREDIGFYDQKQNQPTPTAIHGIKDFIKQKSQLYQTIQTIRLGLKAIQQGVGHTDMDLKSLSKVVNHQIQIDSAVLAHAALVDKYRLRLKKIIRTCQENGITPILLTQPMLWGDYTDPITGVYLGDVEITPESNSLMRWKTLEAYNHALKSIGNEQKVEVIDLANLLEKSSLYFYDEIHFTSEGSMAVAQIIQTEILQRNLIH